MNYTTRVVDRELDLLLPELPAVSLEGPKGVGKTATALQRAQTVFRLDDNAVRSTVEADPNLLVRGAPPILVDEWQRLPESWDVVRRAVDENRTPSRFILTGSATPEGPSTHSGAGRIVRLRMRPLSLYERSLDKGTVSLADITSGNRFPVTGVANATTIDYVQEIIRSGLPGIRGLADRARRIQLQSYLDRIVDTDFQEAGHRVRKPGILRSWLAAYAAATSTDATWETIRDAATPGVGDKPPHSTLLAYREVLERIWVLDPIPSWIPTRNHLARLARPDKHHLADPALAAAILGTGSEALLSGVETGPRIPRDGTLLGHLFESIVALSVRVYAQAAECRVGHLRTFGGRHEVDLIVERQDNRIVAIEVKFGTAITDSDARHLLWLKTQIGDDLLDAVVIYTGRHAFRRPDGIAVIPASLLGP